MYPTNGTVNRLPRSIIEPETETSTLSTIGTTFGTALAQAVALVLVAKIADAVIEAATKKDKPERVRRPVEQTIDA